MNKAVQIAEIAIGSRLARTAVRARTDRKVSFELFFDTTEFGMVENVKDVRELPGPIYKLLKVTKETHAPPRCKLQWGQSGKLFSFGTKVSPWCLLETVSEEFMLFSPTGVPLRAKVNVTFREAWTIEQQLRPPGTPRIAAKCASSDPDRR